jgi:magnesium transporter
MIRLYRSGSAVAETSDVGPGWVLPPDVLWIDLFRPSREEETAIEAALNLGLPTPEEMAELEASSRLYRENGAVFLIADLMHHGDDDLPALAPTTFVITDGPLVTIRYVDPKPFSMLDDRLDREPTLCGCGRQVFLNLMEAVIDRLSNVLSGNAANVEAISGHVFAQQMTVGFDRLITKLGRAHMANARIEQSLSGLARIFAFLGPDDRFEKDAEIREHLRSLGRDAASLIGHAQAVAASINFQLSAALGLINIEQSSIIKIFSVASVCFLPPTLIASIYGMNFEFMPELAQPWGYPLAVAAMVCAAVLPLVWFRKKGWL